MVLRDTMPMNAGPTLTRYRLARGWSIKKLANRSTIDASAVWRMEDGQRRPSREACRLLARALDLSPIEAASLFVSAGHIPDDAVIFPPELIELAAFLEDDDVPEWMKTEIHRAVAGTVELSRSMRGAIDHGHGDT